MRLKIQKVRFKNFLSFGNTWTELEFVDNQISLIVGINGSGKCLDGSTIVDVKFPNEEIEREFIAFRNRIKNK